MMLAYWTHAIEHDGWAGIIDESYLALRARFPISLNASDCVWIVPGTSGDEKYRPRNRLENPEEYELV
jgi:hypothetical protein